MAGMASYVRVKRDRMTCFVPLPAAVQTSIKDVKKATCAVLTDHYKRVEVTPLFHPTQKVTIGPDHFKDIESIKVFRGPQEPPGQEEEEMATTFEELETSTKVQFTEGEILFWTLADEGRPTVTWAAQEKVEEESV